MNTIVKLLFGSHLYRTAGPDSDLDYKGIFMPSAQDILLGRIPKSLQLGTSPDSSRKNLPTDVDYESYSIHYFVELALRGETVALDMLHAPRSAVLESSLVWGSLVSNRQKFYTRNLRSLVGYARRQAAKYGVKGSRLADAREVLRVLREAGKGTKVSELELPDLEHGRWFEPDEGESVIRRVRCYQICGKLLQETARAEHYVGALEKFVDEYGARARQAERNEGIDWKDISHALRAGYQVYYILTDRGFEYPLPETYYLVRVKRGELPFSEVSVVLEDLIDRVEALALESPLPEKADHGWWERWLEGMVADEVWTDLGQRAEAARKWLGT